jgi:hypothetical protein
MTTKAAVTKNYVAKGGEEWVVGGKLTILDGAEVTGLEGGSTTVPKASSMPALANDADLADVIAAYNNLVSALKTAGLMETT